MSGTYLTPPTYAKRLGVKPEKVLAWIKCGQLRAVDVSMHPGVGRPRFRISPAAIVEFEASRGGQRVKTSRRRKRRVSEVLDIIK